MGEAIYARTADALPAALAPPYLRDCYAALHQMARGVSETITPALVSVTLPSGSYTLWVVLAVLAVAATVATELVSTAPGSGMGWLVPTSALPTGRCRVDWSRRP